MVYDDEGAPPCQVNVQQPGTLKCSFPKFKSAMICAHSLAVAEEELCLPEFLALVGKKRNEPDPYQLVRNDLSKSAGDKPSAKRKGKANQKRGPLMEIQSSLQPPQQTAFRVTILALWQPLPYWPCRDPGPRLEKMTISP